MDESLKTGPGPDRAPGQTAAMVGAPETCKPLFPQLCEFNEAAVVRNGESMSNTSKAVGHSHSLRDILDAALAAASDSDVRVWRAQAAVPGYDCVPGRWMIYTL